MYECIERMIKGDAKDEFLQQANLVRSCTVANRTMVMGTMTIQVFPIYAYCDQKSCMQRYLRKPPDMKMRSFTTRLIQLNTYLPSTPDRPGQLVISLSDDDIKKILYYAIPNMWKKKKVKEG